MLKIILAAYVTLFVTFRASAQAPCMDSLRFPVDTTIVMPGGTEITFNRCEFFDLRDCLTINEITSLEDAEAAGLETVDNSGALLLSCGMLEIKTNEECAFQQCFKNPIRIRLPERLNPCNNNIVGLNSLFRLDANGAWEPLPGSKQVTDSKGNRFLEVYTKCVGKFNCDRRVKTVRVKFKVKSLDVVNSMFVSTKCPVSRAEFIPGRRKNIVRAKIPCFHPDSIFIRKIGYDREGKFQTLQQPLSSLSTNFRKTDCKPVSKRKMRRILGIFPRYERNVYRKYLL